MCMCPSRCRRPAGASFLSDPERYSPGVIGASCVRACALGVWVVPPTAGRVSWVHHKCSLRWFCAHQARRRLARAGQLHRCAPLPALPYPLCCGTRFTCNSRYAIVNLCTRISSSTLGVLPGFVFLFQKYILRSVWSGTATNPLAMASGVHGSSDLYSSSSLD